MDHTYSILLCAIASIICTSVKAQFFPVTQGPGYEDAVYYNLSSRSSIRIPHTSWDIAFGVDGRSSAVYVNEGVKASFSAPSPRVTLFASASVDFSAADTADIVAQIFNDERNVGQGAFNTSADPENGLDLGWGSYSPADQSVQGTRIFFIELRDGTTRKLKINSLASGIYTFTSALLDGSDEQTITVNKADFQGKEFAYFSFGESQAKDLEPAEWDLLFTRYTTPLFDGNDTLEYTVTGVLQASGVSTARLDGVDPATVSAPTDGFIDAPNAIGYDWKTFEFSTSSYVLPADRVYFVQTSDSLYRLSFIDFEGSSTGVTIAKIEAEGAVSGLEEVLLAANAIYPNPAPRGEEVSVEVDQFGFLGHVDVQLYDQLGRTCMQRTVNINDVGQKIQISTDGLAPGVHLIVLSTSTHFAHTKLIVH